MNLLEFRETLLSQYANSPTILSILEDFNSNVGTEGDILNFYNTIFNLQTANGFGLDIWGRIVVVSRFLQLVGAGLFFGFHNPNFTQSNQPYTPFNNSPFFNGNSSSSTISVDDDTYRKMILAKAFMNITPPTIPAYNKVLEIILGVGMGYASESNMELSFTFSSPINAVDGAILYTSGIISSPTGVKIIL